MFSHNGQLVIDRPVIDWQTGEVIIEAQEPIDLVPALVERVGWIAVDAPPSDVAEWARDVQRDVCSAFDFLMQALAPGQRKALPGHTKVHYVRMKTGRPPSSCQVYPREDPIEAAQRLQYKKRPSNRCPYCGVPDGQCSH